MQMEIPETPIGALRAAICILARHRIEIGLLKIEPAALYEIFNDSKAIYLVTRSLRDGDVDKVCGIPFEQKRP